VIKEEQILNGDVEKEENADLHKRPKSEDEER
jgi:hypothetical protein